MGLDVAALWDFSDPAESERRFRAAMQGASPDDALILESQIARTWGLRRDFHRAREVLRAIEPKLDGAGAEARVRFALELGRTHVSAAHRPEEMSDADRDAARRWFDTACTEARAGGLDGLAIDALHMRAMVEPDAAGQLAWNRTALEIAASSIQPPARRWEASLRNNIGCTLWELGRNAEALVEFERALELRKAQGNPGTIRVAWWMVAKTLRLLGRIDEALEIQERLEAECADAGDPDPYVFEELAYLHRLKGNAPLADAYAAKGPAG